MFAEARENHQEIMRALRAAHGHAAGGQVEKKKDFELVVKAWVKFAATKYVAKNGPIRTSKGDLARVSMFEVMDLYPFDRAIAAGIPTSGALCAKPCPDKLGTVSLRCCSKCFRCGPAIIMFLGFNVGYPKLEPLSEPKYGDYCLGTWVRMGAAKRSNKNPRREHDTSPLGKN